MEVVGIIQTTFSYLLIANTLVDFGLFDIPGIEPGPGFEVHD